MEALRTVGEVSARRRPRTVSLALGASLLGLVLAACGGGGATSDLDDKGREACEAAVARGAIAMSTSVEENFEALKENTNLIESLADQSSYAGFDDDRYIKETLDTCREAGYEVPDR